MDFHREIFTFWKIFVLYTPTPLYEYMTLYNTTLCNLICINIIIIYDLLLFVWLQRRVLVMELISARNFGESIANHFVALLYSFVSLE